MPKKKKEKKMDKKIEPECPKCHLTNIIFDFDTLPLDCKFCGASLDSYGESNTPIYDEL